MGSGIFGACQGAKVQARYLDIVSNNLANSSTVGYKADDLQFGDFLVQEKPKEYGYVLENEYKPLGANETGQTTNLVKILGQRIDLTQGSTKSTGNDLDLVIQGKGFFQIQVKDETFYSRDGRFLLNADGDLVHSSGGMVLDDSGMEIKLNPDQGKVVIDDDGMIMQGGNEVATLGIVTLPNQMSIKKNGSSLLKYTSQAAPPEEATDFRIQQGFLEGSNVNPISEMTKMIKINRHFEYLTKVIKAYRDTDQQSIQEVGGGR